MERSTFSEDNSVPFRIRSSLPSNLKLLYEPRKPRSRKERNYFLFADYPEVLIFNSQLLYGCDDADARSATSFERAC